MPFKFGLQKVLDYRQQLEEQAMQAVAIVRREMENEARHLQTLNSELAAQQGIMQQSSIMDGAERWLVLSYIDALGEDIKQSKKRLIQLVEELNRRQHELVQKAQERKLLDKLKTKQAERYAEEEKLKEQRNNDETATIRYKKEAF